MQISLFIMESVSCFDKKILQVGNCIITISTKVLEKLFLKILQIFNYNQVPSFH